LWQGLLGKRTDYSPNEWQKTGTVRVKTPLEGTVKNMTIQKKEGYQYGKAYLYCSGRGEQGGDGEEKGEGGDFCLVEGLVIGVLAAARE